MPSWQPIQISSNNTLHNNTIADNKHGIRLEGASNNIITNNSIVKNTGYGMILSHYDLFSMSGDYRIESENNTIQENDFLGNNAGGTQAHDNGMKTVFFMHLVKKN